MKKISYYIVIGLLFLLVIVTFVFMFKAYFTFQFTGIDGKFLDGWGRELTKAPFPMNMILQEESWPGLKWFVFDTVAFWTAVLVGSGLFKLAEVIKNKIK